MTGSDAAHDTHDTHAEHPIEATIVLAVIVGVFAAVFAKMADVSVGTASVIAIGAMLAVFGLLWVWVLDRD
jgi:protein-S-isoprenylcysteine O-methyltransferase Ste14